MGTTKYLAKFQSPRAITRPKINGPERNVNLICNLSLYTHIPNIKSISQSIAKKSGDNYFISELRPLSGEDIKTQNKTFYKMQLVFRLPLFAIKIETFLIYGIYVVI